MNDAYRLLPFAQVLYACDGPWWNAHKGCPDFQGERWSSHGTAGRVRYNDKSAVALRYGLKLVAGQDGNGFSFDPDVIHYGSSSGFQGVNLALLMGATTVILCGFDMQAGAKRHFFGDHPAGLRNTANYANFIRAFDRAAELLPDHIEILNATPGSAMTCFPKVDLNDALMPA